MTGQRKLHSVIESVTNTITGFLVALAMNYWCLPWFGFTPSGAQAITITLLFCSVSMVRGYIFRRLFNRWHVAGAVVVTIRGEPMSDAQIQELIRGVGHAG